MELLFWMTGRRFLDNHSSARISEVRCRDFIVSARRANSVYRQYFIVIGHIWVPGTCVVVGCATSWNGRQEGLCAASCAPHDAILRDCGVSCVGLRPGKIY